MEESKVIQIPVEVASHCAELQKARVREKKVDCEKGEESNETF